MNRTALYDWHVARGARMVPFGGWEMPVQYSGIVDEHRATREAAGLFDTCHMGEIRVRGAGAAATLSRLLTRPVTGLGIGRGRYAFLCAEDGTVIDDTITFRLGEDDFWVVVNAGTREADVQWIVDHATGCDVTDETDVTSKVDLQGPCAESILSDLCQDPASLAAIPRFGIADGEVAGATVRVARAGYTGEDGFEIFGEPDAVTGLVDAICDAGASRGLLPCGLGARDTLRLEAGLPLYGHELSRGRPAHAARMNWAIDMDSDFVGRQQLYAPPPEELVVFRMDGRRAAREGDAVVAAGGGEAAGVVTSGSFCPTLGVAAGMAYIAGSHGTPGSAIGVEQRGKILGARIAKKPLYKRERGA